MKKFVIDGQVFDYHGPRSVIEGLCSMQGQDYSYTEFFQVLKKRLRMWTGQEEVAFYNEDQVVELLQELNPLAISE
ncbi:hypothetical protein [Bacillus sp. T3]|uniref:hypothetical protein n=1 Tax=Bacillus sp. T3 TaxID=467262 RepID=UPI0029829395|nr:hypothetical protein [Bacillus sp. T3]